VSGVFGQDVQDVDRGSILVKQNSDDRASHPDGRLIDVSMIKFYLRPEDSRKALQRKIDLSFIASGQSPEHLLALLQMA
jgi:hypothetical protein